jgi:phosphatidylserine/phosphatidylglycerophosphate/cardiolipin synthase-like enzyme
MADFAAGKIQVFAGPQELGAPHDLEQVIVEFIDGAEKTLDIAVQELDSEPIAQAIIDARWRGISVRVFLEQDYLDSKSPPRSRVRVGADESEEDAIRRVQWTEVHRRVDERTNRDILAALLRNGIDVKADYNPNIFHQKFIVRDYRRSAKPNSAVLTGSTISFTM